MNKSKGSSESVDVLVRPDDVADVDRDVTVSRRPVLAIVIGRGNVGKSITALELTYHAWSHGRDPIIADFDTRTKTLSSQLDKKAFASTTEVTADQKEDFTKILNQVADERRSLIADFGGGDRVLQEFGQDLDLIELCRDCEMNPIAIYVMGPDPGDLEHCLAIYKSGHFKTENSLVIFNEGGIRDSKSPLKAFGDLIESPVLNKITTEGVKPLFMPVLPCMPLLIKEKLDFYKAAAGEYNVAKLPRVQRAMTQRWIRNLKEQRDELGVSEWLP